jgi:hypothetical protein
VVVIGTDCIRSWPRIQIYNDPLLIKFSGW